MIELITIWLNHAGSQLEIKIRDSLDCNKLGLEFSKDVLCVLEELGNVLKIIHKRMYNEGYEIIGGVVRKR